MGTLLTGALELGVHNYINLKILGGHMPVCPPYEYGPATNLENTHFFLVSLLESQSKGCVNPTFDLAHKCIFAVYLQGRICTVGTQAHAHPIF